MSFDPLSVGQDKAVDAAFDAGKKRRELEAALAQERARNAALEKTLAERQVGQAPLELPETKQPATVVAPLIQWLRDWQRIFKNAGGEASADRVGEVLAAIDSRDGLIRSQHLQTEAIGKAYKERDSLRAALAAAPSSTEPRQDAPAPCADRVISGIIIPSGPPPNVEQALRNFVNAVEAYKETGVWPDNSTIRQLADEGMDALKWSGPDAPAQVSAPDEQAQAQ